MFDSISKRYDFLNHFLSLGIDKGWRRKAIAKLKNDHPKLILDVATGTADLAMEGLTLNPDKIIGVDLSEGMLGMGRIKISKAGKSDKIELLKGSYLFECNTNNHIIKITNIDYDFFLFLILEKIIQIHTLM